MVHTRQNMLHLHGSRTCRFCNDENINETPKQLMEECPEIEQKLGKYEDIFKNNTRTKNQDIKNYIIKLVGICDNFVTKTILF